MEPVPVMESLTDRVHAELRRAIINGQLVPGTLHSIYKLAEQLGVSRTPVREALVKLAEQGMVAIERNRGVRILSTSVHDLEEILSLRLLLEIPATRRAASMVTDELMDGLADALQRMRDAADVEDIHEMMVHDRRFHRLILEAAGNLRLAAIVDDLRDLILTRGASTANRTRSLDVILEEHRALMEAVRAGDPQLAGDLMLEHLTNTGRLLLSQEAQTDPAETALAWAQYVAPSNATAPR